MATSLTLKNSSVSHPLVVFRENLGPEGWTHRAAAASAGPLGEASVAVDVKQRALIETADPEDTCLTITNPNQHAALRVRVQERLKGDRFAEPVHADFVHPSRGGAHNSVNITLNAKRRVIVEQMAV